MPLNTRSRRSVKLLSPPKASKLHCTQAIVFWHPARTKVLVAGRRWGKSRLGLTFGLQAALGRLPTVEARQQIRLHQDDDEVFRRGKWPAISYPYDPESPPIVVFAMPTLKQCKKIFWKPLLNLLRDQPFVEEINRSEFTIRLKGNRPEIICIGLNDQDGDRARGLRIAACVIDEFQDVKPSILDEVIRPAMADTPNSELLLTGTPKGKVNHLCKVDQETALLSDGASFHFETLDNPHIDPAEVARAEATQDPRIFRQEFKASYEDFPGQIFDHLGEHHLLDEVTYHQFLEQGFDLVTLGVDWGDVNPALAVVGRCNGIWIVLDTWHSSTGLNVMPETHLEKGQAMVQRFSATQVYCGHDRPTNMQIWSKALKPLGVNQCSKGIMDISRRNSIINGLLYHDRLFLAPHMETFKDKLSSYHRKQDKNGKILEDVAEGQDDHEIDALCYACATVIHREETAHRGSRRPHASRVARKPV
jgi:hypothetical protein